MNGLEPPDRVDFQRARQVRGRLLELKESANRYFQLLEQLAEVEGRLDALESSITALRDEWDNELVAFDGEAFDDEEWQKLWDSIKYVGKRLGDAAAACLQSHGKPFKTGSIVRLLQLGGYRFHTNKPIRETHAALLRTAHVKKLESGEWVWDYKQGPTQRTVDTGEGEVPIEEAPF